MKIAIAIPARLNSSRLPKKVLADLCGKPMVQHVYETAKAAGVAEKVHILVDDPEVAQVAEKFCGDVIMTDPNCASGTERIVSALDKIEGDLVINVQGDEPLLAKEVLAKVGAKALTSAADIVTPIFSIPQREMLDDPACVKVVLAKNGYAMYFSRHPIPFVRGVEKAMWMDDCQFFGHMGVYCYKREILEKYPNLQPCKLEKAESLEQLRFLYNGYTIDTVLTSKPTIGVDTMADLEKARNLLAQAF